MDVIIYGVSRFRFGLSPETENVWILAKFQFNPDSLDFVNYDPAQG